MADPRLFGSTVAPVPGGRLIGRPGEGTHSYTALPNNWESDRAIDLAVPEGTPVYAVAPGRIGPRFGALDSSDPRMQGLRLHLETAGDEFYYAHLSSFAPGIGPGVSVTAGQLLGFSGSAAGVAHLHFAQRAGNPLAYAQGTASGNPETTGIPTGGGGGGACDTICVPCDKIPLPDILKRANPLCIPCFLCRTKGGVDDIGDAITAVPRALGFLFSWRFVELVGGGALLIVGLIMLGRQLGVPTPTIPGVPGAR